MKKILFVTFLAVSLLSLVFGSTPPGRAEETILKLAVSQEWPTLDPGQWAVSCTGLEQVYENLFRFKPGTTQVEPWLAESYDLSPDKKTYTFRLRKGVKFHDGIPFNAQAVIFNIDRAKWYKGTGLTWIKLIQNAQAVDDYTVKLTLEAPSAIFLTALAYPSVLRFVSPTAVKAHEKDGDWAKAWLASHDAGTGPYTIKDETKMSHILLEKFPDYWRGWKGKHVDKVYLKYVREPSTRKMMLLNKEVDISENLLFDDVDELKKVPHLNIDLPSTTAVTLLVFRWTKGPGGEDNPILNRKFREALNYAVDYDGIIKVSMKGAAKQLQGTLAGKLFEQNNRLQLYKRDVAKAKQLLKESGYKEGQVKLTIMYNPGYEWKRLASETLKSNFKDIGVDLDILVTAWPQMVASMQDGTLSPPPHMYVYFASSVVDGYTTINRLFHSQSIGSPKDGPRGWNPGYVNPALDKALEAAQVAPTLETYKKHMLEAQEILHKDMPYLPLWELVFVSSMSKRVKGYIPNPIREQDYNFYEMYLE